MTVLGMSLMINGRLPKPAATKDNKLNRTARFVIVSILAEALISLSALAIGIISVLGIIPGMPPMAGFAFISLSVGITSAWIASAILFKGANFQIAKALFCAALSPNPDKYLHQI